MTNAELKKLKSEIGRIVHGDFHAVHGWDTPLVNKLVKVFKQYHAQEVGLAKARFAEEIQRKVDLEYQAGGKYPGHIIEPWADVVRPIVNREAAKLDPPAKEVR